MIRFLAVPCSFNSNVTIQFGATKFSLRPETLNLGPVSENSPDCVGGISASDANGERYASSCFCGSSKIEFWVLGDPLLQNTYTVFDFDQKRIGFATPV